MAEKTYRLQVPVAPTRRIRIASWAVMGVFVLIPVGCALAAIAFAFARVSDRSAADAYSAAPTCAPVGPAAPASAPAHCRRLLPAVVESTRVVRSGKSLTTSVSLLVAGDRTEHRAAAAASLTPVVAVLLAASVTVWPRLTWVRRPGLSGPSGLKGL